MAHGQAAAERVTTAPRPEQFEKAGRKPDLWVVNDNVVETPYTPENPYADPESAAGAMVRTSQPVIILTADKAESYGAMSKYITETFPGVPIIFEDEAAKKAFGRASWNHYAKGVTIGTIGEGRIDRVIQQADRVITFGGHLKHATRMMVKKDVKTGDAPMAILALNQGYEEYGQAATRWCNWFRRANQMAGVRRYIA